MLVEIQNTKRETIPKKEPVKIPERVPITKPQPQPEPVLPEESPVKAGYSCLAF